MAVGQNNIIPGVQLTAALATYHTAPANTRERICNATLTNDTANVIVATVHIITSGDAAATKNKKIAARSIAPGESYTCPELINRILNPGDFIQAVGNGLAFDVSAIFQV